MRSGTEQAPTRSGDVQRKAQQAKGAANAKALGCNVMVRMHIAVPST